MAKQLIETRNPTRLRRCPETCVGVRAYKDTSETVCVQIRLGKQYATVSLMADEAKRFAKLISDAALSI